MFPSKESGSKEEDQCPSLKVSGNQSIYQRTFREKKAKNQLKGPLLGKVGVPVFPSKETGSKEEDQYPSLEVPDN